MEVSFNNNSATSLFNNPLRRKKWVNFLVLSALTCALFLVMMHGCLADTTTDLLKPGDAAVKGTFGKDSSLMTWLLIGEVVTAILAYVISKNVKLLFGVIVLSVFINIAFAIIG
jgi:type IV conjugative transfer system pilin TraA